MCLVSAAFPQVGRLGSRVTAPCAAFLIVTAARHLRFLCIRSLIAIDGALLMLRRGGPEEGRKYYSSLPISLDLLSSALTWARDSPVWIAAYAGGEIEWGSWRCSMGK